MRIAIAGFTHETQTFLPGKTGIDDFGFHQGQSIIRSYSGTNTTMGGFIEACRASGVELVPVVYAPGGVSGTVTDEAYRLYAGAVCRGLREAGELDGVLLSLHGAMVTESLHDPETYIVRDVRQVVGYGIPVMAGMDLHGNLDPALLQEATAIAGFRSSPHTDAGQTGRRTARLMLDTLSGKVRPCAAMVKPGLVIPSVFSATTRSPARDIIARAMEWQEEPGVLDVSFFFGFAWADVRQLGAAAVAITDGDPGLAKHIAADLSELAWSHRKELTSSEELYSVRDGVARAVSRAQHAKKPVIILDHADRLNDTTFVLRELLEQGVEGAAVPLFYDPEAARECAEAGVGSRVEVMCGSRSSPQAGGPVRLSGVVEWAGEKSYIGTGPMRRGARINHGLTAIVNTGGLWVQLVSRQASLIDADPIIQFGRRLEDFKIIVTKSKTHFRAVYEEAGEEIIIVDAPAYSPADLGVYQYRNVPPGVYPITLR